MMNDEFLLITRKESLSTLAVLFWCILRILWFLNPTLAVLFLVFRVIRGLPNPPLISGAKQP